MSAVDCGSHVLQILFEFPAAHAVADDVEQGEHACRGSIDDALLEVVEIAPSRSACIDDRRDARLAARYVRIDAVVAGI